MKGLYTVGFIILGLCHGKMLLAGTEGVGATPAASAYTKYFDLYKRPKEVPYPKDNQYSEKRAFLGRTLFFDPRLSGSDWISCGTCHNPALSWGDGLPKGIGHGMKAVGRRTPTVLNLAWAELLFWDGRAASLEEQAIGPIAAEGEMNLPLDKMLTKLSSIASYKTLFEQAYPGEGITKDTIAKAIATYERTIVSGEAPFDRWIKGNESAVSVAAKRGFVLFNEKALCSQCHSGWRFTDDSFHDIGLADADIGRAKILAGIAVLEHAFKTPTLRNVDHRAPYMHDGSETTLAAVINFYDQGGKAKRASLSEHIKKLSLSTSEKEDLEAFLHTLTSVDKPVEIPMLPR